MKKLPWISLFLLFFPYLLALTAYRIELAFNLPQSKTDPLRIFIDPLSFYSFLPPLLSLFLCFVYLHSENKTKGYKIMSIILIIIHVFYLLFLLYAASMANV